MVTELFLDLAGRAAGLVSSDEVRARWDEASALQGYTVAGLAGHLGRAVLTVEKYLGAGGTDAPGRMNAARYFAAILGDHDPIGSGFHGQVRARGEETAAAGAEALAQAVLDSCERLRNQLDERALAGGVEVLAGVNMTVADYLKTRVVELVVHMDDLAVSVGLADLELPGGAHELAAGVLGELAAIRSGGWATVRSLARAERHPEAVRAL